MCFASFRARISFFHFSSRTPFDRGLDDLYPTWSCAHWLAVHRCDVELRKARSKKDSRTRWRGSSRVEEFELETLTALVQQSPSFRRRPCSPTSAGGADAGAEQWYLTIAKLMRGRNSNPHKRTASEPRGPCLARRRAGTGRNKPISSELPG